MGKVNDVLDTLSARFNRDKYRKLNETMSFQDYLNKALIRPQLGFSAFQRMYDMILSAGVKTFDKYRKTINHYNFFDDNSIPIFGLYDTLDSLVKHIKAGANWYGTERRILLLHGPVGSSKSTICRRLKKGLEEYSRTEEGAIYTYDWVNVGEIDIKPTVPCPMNDNPLKLIPQEIRSEIVKSMNEAVATVLPPERQCPINIVGELNPCCKYFMNELLRRYDGDWSKVVEGHIRVRRIAISEADRVGIATFQPKDSKNQDATELTGDINYMKLGHYGVDSDPRAFSFDGELEVANRGMIELIEVLKLDKEFLYDFLGVSQERQFKPKKFSQVDVDLVIISHSNNPEFEKLKADNTMEAFRDRTVRIDVPYLLELKEEIKVLNHDYGPDKIVQHIAPHTIQTAALVGILSRLKPTGNDSVDLVDKALLYDGKSMPNWTEDKVKELRLKSKDEGLLRGLSARFLQNAISNTLVSNRSGYINPFMVLNEIREKLAYLMINDESERSFYETCVDLAKKHLDEILKEEVQEAIVSDPKAIERLFHSYIDNVVAHVDNTKILDPYTNMEVEPNERLMRQIEEKGDIPEQHADDFRRQIAQFIGTQSIKKKGMAWDSHPGLSKALKAKLFEDAKDTIKVAKLSQHTLTAGDQEIQEKIEGVKTRLIRDYGYNYQSASDVLNYVSSIFARGELIKSN